MIADAVPTKQESQIGRRGWSLVERYGLVVGLAVLVVTGLLGLGRRGIWLDEGYSWSIVAQPDLGGFIEALDLTVSNMFGYMTLLRAWMVLGDDPATMRLLSLIFAVATVPLVWGITTRVATKEAAGVAAMLAGASVPLVFYGMEVRSYSMLAFCSALSWYLLLRALEDDRRWQWIALGGATLLAISAHVIALVALPSLGAAVLLRFRIDKAIVRLLPVGFSALVGLGLIAIATPRDTAGFPPPLSISVIVRSARLLAGDHGVLTRDGSGFVLIVGFLAIFAGAAFQQWQRRSDRSLGSWAVWIWFLGPPATTTLVSLVEPLLWHRMLIGSLPATFVVAGVFLSDVRWRLPALLATVAIVLLGVVRTESFATADLWEFEDLAAELRTRSEPGDVLAFTHPWERVGLDYYFRDETDRFVTSPPMGPVLDYGEFSASSSLLSDREPGDRIWLIDGADAAPVWKGDLPSSDEFVFDEAVASLPASAELEDSFELGRFSARLYVIG